jgi:eukaryotic-like serine/threonine-protein kinase
MSCLTDETFAAWASGQLGEDERDAAEGHAAECGSCRGIAMGLHGLVARAVAAPLGATGATIGRYRVVGPLGHGAMGVVLRGHDPVLEREVAIKMVNAIAATAAQRARMLHEAKMLALVEHPNVVHVHDAGIVDDEAFVVMEYVTGSTLLAWLDVETRSLAVRLEVLVGIGGGIAAIHDAGLVHRDIKPDNIVVHDTRAVIVDLGLARSVGGTGPVASGIAGTPRFAAPEVLAGASASALADQYAWWMVVADVMHDVQLPPRAQRALAAAVTRGTASQPDARFANMSDAVAALAAACRPRRRWRAAAVAVAAIVIVAFAGIGTARRAGIARQLGACTAAGADLTERWSSQREVIHRAFRATGTSYAQSTFEATARVYDAYVPALAARTEGACRASVDDPVTPLAKARRSCLERRARELRAQLDQLARASSRAVLKAAEGAWATAEPMCDDDRSLVFGPPGTTETSQQLVDQLARGRELMVAGQLDEAAALATSTLTDARAHGDVLAQLRAWQLMGDVRDKQKQPDAAIDAYQQALDVAEAQNDDLEAARMLAMLAEQLGNKRDSSGAHRLVAVALARLERIGDNPTLAGYLHRIDASVFHFDFRCHDAETEIRKALALYEHAYGGEHPDVGVVLSELSNFSCDTTAATVDAATRALAILERAYGAEHPHVAGAHLNLANELIDLGRLAEAHDQLARADAIFERALGPDDPSRTLVQLGLGRVADKQHDPAGALAYYRRAGVLIDASPGPDSPAAGANHTRIADVLLDQSRFSDALDEYRRAIAIIEHSLGMDHPQLLGAVEGAARAQLRLGHAGDAVVLAESALALATLPSADVDDSEVPEVRWLLARALWDSGRDRNRACELARQASAGKTSDADEIAAWLAAREGAK